MNIYLMRHGIPIDAGNPGDVDDSQRPLTDKGVKRMRRAVRGLRRLGEPGRRCEEPSLLV